MKKIKQIEDLLRPIWDSAIYPLKINDNAFHTIVKKPSFVYPQMNTVCEADLPRILLISAPGAVGKTTFAKFASYTKKGYYLDLSKLKLGDNTFVGTLAKYFGSENLSNVLVDLSKGDVSLFIDAFDEAEIISGWNGVENFIRDVNEFCKSSLKTNIILFSRSETASYIKMLLEDIAGSNTFSMYEIEYFDEINSIQFIHNFLDEKNDSNIKSHKEPFKQACNSIFKIIAKGIDSSCENIWENEEIRSFIGYSPVLQTIGAYMHEQNFSEIKEQFDGNNSAKTGLELIAQFIQSLLKREQDKFLGGFRIKIQQIPNLPNNIDDAFDPHTQLSIVTQYIERGCNNINSLQVKNVPAIVTNEFMDSLRQFLPNHPFIRNSSFSSPAFRDYSLAYLISNENEFAHAKKLLETESVILTPLFAHFYSKFSNNKCSGPHVGYIYESVISRQSFNDSVILTNIKSEKNEYTVEIITDDRETSQFKFTCLINEHNPLIFERRLNHARISISHCIHLGRTGSSVELKDVELRANEVQILSKECILNCHEGDEIYIEAQKFKQPMGFFTAKKIGEGTVKVFWPDSKNHPWSDYSLIEAEKIDENHAETIHDLKRILGPFRKHKKKEFAKFFPFIENIIVGESPNRKKLLQYLLSVGILSKNNANSQYIMHPEKINKHGFSWADVKSTSSNQAIIDFIVQYKASST